MKNKKKKDNQSVALPNSDVVADPEHSKLVRWVNEADDATLFSRDLSEKCRLYYDSKQWTDAEIKKLAAQKQAATVINRIKPKMDGLMGMERANRTTAKAHPRTPKHAQGATAATEGVRYVLQNNFYDQHRSEAWENLLIEGTGGVEIIAEDEGEGKEVRLTINHIMWDRIIYDPHSRRKDFSDARYLGQVVWMDYDEAVAKFPEAGDVLEAMQTGSSTYDDKPRWMDNTRRRVKIVELYYYKADGEVWYSCFTLGGYVKEPKKSPYVNEEGETEWPYEFGSLFVDREGNRYGACRQYLDVQDEINKRRSKALHLMSVRQVRWERGAVEDINKARAELAKPDGVLETTPGMEFEILKTGDMAAAQFNLLTEAKSEIDAVGYNAAASGKDERSMSGVALRERTMASQTELAPMFDVLKHLDIRVYRKVWNRIKQYWKAEKWIRITDDENKLKFVGLNTPQTKGQTILKQAQEQGAPPEALQQLQARIAMDPTMQEVVGTENDIAELDVDIVMDDAPNTVTQQIEDFQAMAEMVKSGFPIPPKAVILASPLSNKDQILKMMEEQPQVPPELQKKMEEMSEQLKGLAEENQALKTDQAGEQAKLQLSAQEAQAKLAQRQAETKAELELKAQTQAAELQLERERAEATIQLERMKAEAQIQLQGMKIQGDQQQQSAKLAFDQECRAKDEEAKVQEQAKKEEAPLLENAMPKFVQALEAITKTFAQALESIAATQSELARQQSEVAQAANADKSISIKMPDGRTASALVTVK